MINAQAEEPTVPAWVGKLITRSTASFRSGLFILVLTIVHAANLGYNMWARGEAMMAVRQGPRVVGPFF